MRTVRNTRARVAEMGRLVTGKMQQLNTVIPLGQMNGVTQAMQQVQGVDAASKGQRANTPVEEISKRFIATVNAVSQMPELTLHANSTLKWPEMTKLSDNLHQSIQTGNMAALNSLGRQVEQQLVSLVQAVKKEHSALAQQEIQSTMEPIQSSLMEIGFTKIRQQEEQGRILLRAENPEGKVIVANVSAEGPIQFDQARFPGRECEKTMAALQAKLQEKGLIAQRKQMLFHGRAEGGELVRETDSIFNPLTTSIAAPVKAGKEHSAEEQERRRRLLHQRQRLHTRKQ